jgi:hypothetical protein
MISAGDTRLHAVDAPGGTPALLFLSGGFGTVRNWSSAIGRLDGKYRTVRFDARARGKSGRSADYSVMAAVDDIGRVIGATGIEGPILVRTQFRRLGWLMRIPAALSRSARMSPAESADVVIEMDAVNGELAPTSRRWNARPFSWSAPEATYLGDA